MMSTRDERRRDMNAAKKAKIEPVFPDKIDGVDKPLLQTLATVCQKLYDEKLYAEFKPQGGAESNDMLEQPYELVKNGVQGRTRSCYLRSLRLQQEH